MAIHFPESNLKILDYNRVLKTINDLTPEQFLEKISDSYEIKPVEEGDDPKPKAKQWCSLYLDKKWYALKVKDEKVDKTNPVKQLDS